MPTRLWSVVVDASDPSRLGRFWSDALDWPVVYEEPDEVFVAPPPERAQPGPVGLVFCRVPEAKGAKNRIHLDFNTTSPEHHDAEVARLRSLGATPADIGQGEVPWVVLADPEGNELCVLGPDPDVQGAGPIAGIVVDCVDPAAMAAFWSEATGWPLSAADDESGQWVALRAPADGAADAARGPYLEFIRVPEAKLVKNRLHLDVAPFKDDDHQAEVDRLRNLGATPVDIGQGDVPWVVLADPEGQEFCVLTPRASLAEHMAGG